ncbi:MAG: hypothetical protein WCZ28_06140 [Burkholderiaceae bacterium]
MTTMPDPIPDLEFCATGRGTECRLNGETVAVITYHYASIFEVWPCDEIRTELGQSMRMCHGALAARLFATVLAAELSEWRGPGYAAASAQAGAGARAAPPEPAGAKHRTAGVRP